MKDQLDTLFSKEMTRKEFLQHIGSALLIVFGITGVVNALQPKAQRQDMGYGNSVYGGVKR